MPYPAVQYFVAVVVVYSTTDATKHKPEIATQQKIMNGTGMKVLKGRKEGLQRNSYDY